MTSAKGSEIGISGIHGNDGTVTVEQFAAVSGLTTRAVRLACAQGRLSAVKKAGAWHIDLAELARES